jgi:GntR family transcriptional regulator, transcriptional repressor for pyruvate dehydrogenase complex
MLTKAMLDKSPAKKKVKPGPKSGKMRLPSDPAFTPQFAQVRTRRIFEEICEQVRREMSAGTLRPGDKLPAERELATQFGVSRTAVREALRSLEIAGIVGLQKGMKGGAFILKGDLDLITRSMRDMFYLGRISLDSLTEARALVLKTAVGLVSERITPNILAALRQNTDRLADLPRASSVSDRIEISAEFYDLLAKATGNEVLQIIMESLSAIVLQRVAERHMVAMPNLVAHRRRLIEHLADHDAEAAQEEIGIHLQKLHKHLMSEERLNDKRRTEARNRA